MSNPIRIFWDLDETLIHSSYSEPEQEHERLVLDHELYYSIVRPDAKKAIDLSRQVAGDENVFILTIATWEYAAEANRLMDFGFSNENIIDRYEIKSLEDDRRGLKNERNLLIDNLPPLANGQKLLKIGINHTWHQQYLQVRDFFGAKLGDNFFEKTRDFILDRYYAD